MISTVFFGEQGLTSTSANHIANLAKEYGTTLNGHIINIQMYTTNMALLSGEGERLIEKGVDEDAIRRLPAYFDEIAQVNSLIAWLREAIKAKAAMEKEINALTLEEYLEDIGETLEKPTKRECMTEESLIAELSVKQRNRIFMLQTKAAKLGKYIHPEGLFSVERDELRKKIQAPNKVEEKGRDTVIYSYTPSVSVECVDDVFFQMQNEYRETQAEYNGIMHSIKEKARLDEMAAQADYYAACDAYEAKREVLKEKMRAYQKKEAARVSSLKIIIPNDLREIYEKVNGLGK